MSGILTVLAGMGAGSAQIIVNDLTVFDSVPMGTAEARYILNGDGFVYQYTSSSGQSQVEEWVIPTDEANNYEARATYVSGTTASGPAYGSWHSLGSAKTWSLATTTFAQGVFDIDIRDSATQTIRGTGRITLFASAV